MRRNAALLVTLLLVATGAVVAPAVVGADASGDAETNPLVVSVNGSANYLAIPDGEVQRTATTDTGLAVGTAIAGDTRGLESDHATIAFERAFAAAETQSEHTDVVRDAVDRLERRTESLQERDREATRGFADGSLTAHQYARQRAQIDAEARELQTTRAQVVSVAGRTSGYSLPQSLNVRLANLQGELETLGGPVSEHVGAAAGGTDRPQTVYAEASADGYTLAYVDDGTYVRETYLGDERQPTATDQFAASDEPRQNLANSRGHEIYPWVTNQSVSPSTQGIGTSGIYRFSVNFQGGQLTTYIDGGTTNAFRESQEQRVSSMQVSETVAEENGTLQVRLNRTYEGGPMQVTLSRTGTGAAANGTVAVNGHEVGQTGPDGTLWTVEPRGPVNVTATTPTGDEVVGRIPA